jgi:hypothetical protein
MKWPRRVFHKNSFLNNVGKNGPDLAPTSWISAHSVSGNRFVSGQNVVRAEEWAGCPIPLCRRPTRSIAERSRKNEFVFVVPRFALHFCPFGFPQGRLCGSRDPKREGTLGLQFLTLLPQAGAESAARSDMNKKHCLGGSARLRSGLRQSGECLVCPRSRTERPAEAGRAVASFTSYGAAQLRSNAPSRRFGSLPNANRGKLRSRQQLLASS